jgi:EAL domain-containing protein (putative c-di-GMP-specific phosphodiesterase class I)
MDKTTKMRINNIILTLGAFVSAGLTGILATLSMPVGIMAFGFMALAFFMLFEQNRRQAWEEKAQAHFGSFNTSFDVAGLRQTVQAQQKLIKHQGTLIDENRRRLNKVEQHLNARKNLNPVEPKPSKVVPFHAAPPPANDEPASYYNALSDTVVRELISSAVRRDKIAVFKQAIMRLPEETVRGYEVFSRVRSRPNHYIPAKRYIDLARADQTIDLIEPVILMQCLDRLKEEEHAKGSAQIPTYFINICTSTLKNKIFIGRLLAFLKNNRKLATSLVFELSQNDFNTATSGVLKVMKALGQLGCSFSLDHMKFFNLSPEKLNTYRIRFVRINAGSLVNILKSKAARDGFKITKRGLERHGIGVIAEKIENRDMLGVINGFDLHYGQGYIFEKPQLLEKAA